MNRVFATYRHEAEVKALKIIRKPRTTSQCLLRAISPSKSELNIYYKFILTLFNTFRSASRSNLKCDKTKTESIALGHEDENCIAGANDMALSLAFDSIDSSDCSKSLSKSVMYV